jgi:hypothetical protein
MNLIDPESGEYRWTAMRRDRSGATGYRPADLAVHATAIYAIAAVEKAK